MHILERSIVVSNKEHIELNEKLLSKIKRITIMSLIGDILTEDYVKSMPSSDLVYMYLECEADPSLKLGEEHYAKLTVEEALVYINLGIEMNEGEQENEYQG